MGKCGSTGRIYEKGAVPPSGNAWHNAGKWGLGQIGTAGHVLHVGAD